MLFQVVLSMCALGQKKVVLFLRIGWIKKMLSLTHQIDLICIIIYIFNLKKKKKKKAKIRRQKEKETIGEKRISGKSNGI